MPSPAIVNGLSTVARIWMEEPKVICQNVAPVEPMASAVKKYIAAVVKCTMKLKNNA